MNVTYDYVDNMTGEFYEPRWIPEHSMRDYFFLFSFSFVLHQSWKEDPLGGVSYSYLELIGALFSVLQASMIHALAWSCVLEKRDKFQ